MRRADLGMTGEPANRDEPILPERTSSARARTAALAPHKVALGIST